METKVVALPSWDVLVFERRNRSYGAYLLRRMYFRRLLLGFGASVSIIAFMLLVPALYRAAPRTATRIIEVRPIVYPPPIVPQKKQPKSETRQKNNVITSTIQVTTEQVESPDPVQETPPVNVDNGSDKVVGIDQGTPAVTTVVLPTPDDILINPEVRPEYAGGPEAMMKYLTKNLRYPPTPRRLGIEGTVYVSFVVRGDGTVDMVEVIRGIHPDCDREAIRVISKMPAWKGGRQNGIPVGVRMVLPIRFRLEQ